MGRKVWLDHTTVSQVLLILCKRKVMMPAEAIKAWVMGAKVPIGCFCFCDSSGTQSEGTQVRSIGLIVNPSAVTSHTRTPPQSDDRMAPHICPRQACR